MLHPTKLPDCADLLERVLDFQEQLLELGCLHSQLSPDDFRQALGTVVFEWLDSTNNTRKLYQPIYSFAKLPPEEKNAILADFRHDRQYTQHLDDPNFQFRLLGDSDDENRQRIRSWLVNFYDQFSRGGLTEYVTGDEVINKATWQHLYDQANDHCKNGRCSSTCAVCDGTMNHAITVEHYLPKSRYPVLALHPHNLIPVCDKCNSLKSDKDPLNGRTFLSVFMPYRKAIRQVAHLEFKERQEGVEQIQIVPNSPDTSAEKVRSLSELFDLPGQWQRNIHEISQIAYRRVQQHFRSLHDAAGIVPTDDEIPEHLERVCRYMEKDWGIEHYGYPATEWLKWAKNNKAQALKPEIQDFLNSPTLLNHMHV